MADVAAGVNGGELSGIDGLKRDISLKLAQKVQLDNEIAALESGYMPETAAAGSASAVTGQVLEIRSPGTGVVSFYSDGQEEALKPALYRNIQLESVNAPPPRASPCRKYRPAGCFTSWWTAACGICWCRSRRQTDRCWGRPRAWISASGRNPSRRW